MIDTLYFFEGLGFSLLLGMLIGIEREKKSQIAGLSSFGGIRTMSLVGMLGYLVYVFFGEAMPLFSIFTGGFLLMIVSAYVISSVLGKDYGATSEIATFFVYITGVLVGMGEYLIATVVTLLVLALLYLKKPLHTFVKRVEKEEVYDTVKFIVVVFVILPLLPNQTFGPLDILNPYNIWLMVIFISGISFVSYVAIKLVGPKKGIGLGGLLGGLVSSTAVSMSFSNLSKRSKSIVDPFVFGILIASSAMFFRVLLEVTVLNRALFPTLMVPMGAMGITGVILSFFYWFKRKGESRTVTDKQLNLQSPFQLWPALQFGLFFAALLFISKFVSLNFGDQGLYLTAFISGFVDVDAITVSMSNLSLAGDISNFAAATTITIATMTNTLVKGIIVLSFGSHTVGRKTFTALILIMAVGLLSLLLFKLNLVDGITSVVNGVAW
ncbi:MgtC/SapB family protein [Patescibacteria group bacterium]|nr:MgtC/SapB family protein [Patescibacteria group bacterium]